MLRRLLLGLSWVHLALAALVVGFAAFAVCRFLVLAHWADAILSFRPFDHEANAVERVVRVLEQPRSILALVVPVAAYVAALIATWRFFRLLARRRPLPKAGLSAYLFFVLACLALGGYWSRAASLATLAQLTAFMPPAQPAGVAAVPFYLLWLVYWVGRLLPSLWGPATLTLAVALTVAVRWVLRRQLRQGAELPA